jgi:phosphate-selective porin OprO/OprP
MRAVLLTLAIIALLPGAAAAQTAATQPTSAEQPSEPPMFGMRGGRPTLTLGDGNLTIQPVTRFDLDMGGFRDQPLYYNGLPPKYLDDTRPGVPAQGLNMRRARLGLQGTYLQDFTYNFTWEFAQAPGTSFEPVKLSRLFELQTAYTGFGWITPRIGAFTLMHTIEFSMSSFELTFMERPSIIVVATSLASGDTRLAVGGEARGDRWFASAYAVNGSGAVLNDGRQRGFVGRANGVLVNEDSVKVILGLNAAAQLAPGTTGSPDTIRLRDYPELRLDPTRLLDTRSLVAGEGYAVGPELSAMLGPLYLQSEYQWVRISGDDGAGNRNFWGYYVTAAMPLIGAPRRHDRNRGVFARPRVEELNPKAGTWGWLELAARWSYINLNDAPTFGGTQGVLSVGLNYYPTSRLRVTLQYSNGSTKLSPGTPNSTTGADRAFQALAARVSFNW